MVTIWLQPHHQKKKKNTTVNTSLAYKHDPSVTYQDNKSIDNTKAELYRSVSHNKKQNTQKNIIIIISIHSNDNISNQCISGKKCSIITLIQRLLYYLVYATTTTEIHSLPLRDDILFCSHQSRSIHVSHILSFLR